MDEVIAAALVFDTPPALPQTDAAALPLPVDEVIQPEQHRIEIVQDIAIVTDEPQ
jgi:hypothetical protein